MVGVSPASLKALMSVVIISWIIFMKLKLNTSPFSVE